MALIDRWQKRPWTAAELHALAAHLADAGEAAEAAADAREELHEQVDRLGELVDAIADQVGRHARPEPTPGELAAREDSADWPTDEVSIEVPLGEPVATTPRPWPDPDFEPEDDEAISFEPGD
ncbi:MAG: hypothetical protein WKF75_05615 [Singulisphaera sp.]